jgi:hypothetical protein
VANPIETPRQNLMNDREIDFNGTTLSILQQDEFVNVTHAIKRN